MAAVLLEDGHTPCAAVLGAGAESVQRVTAAAEFAAEIAGQRFGVLVEHRTWSGTIVVESAIYGDANGVPWQAGANALATRLRR